MNSSKKIPTPKPPHDYDKNFVYNEKMCKTCAYHIPLTEDEIEYEKSMIHLRPEGHHPCHERRNSWCVGSVNTVKKLRSEK